MNRIERQLHKTIKLRVTEQLKLISSKEAQLEYQRQVPIAHVKAELFCGWADDLAIEESLNEHWFTSAFTASELNAINEFNNVLNRIADSAPDVSLEEFIQTSDWLQLSTAASNALEAFAQEPK